MPTHCEDGFLACHDCQLLAPVAAPHHAAPDDDDAYRDFTAAHATHHTTLVSGPTSETWSDRPLWDPMATISFEVTDGTQRCVVHASRQSIDEPRVYRFAPGSLQVVNTTATIDDGDVRRGLDLRFYPHAIRPTKLDRFAVALQQVVNRIPPQQLEIAFDVADDPALGTARMPDAAFQEVLSHCTQIFDRWELPRVREFLLDNRLEDGLLALCVRRDCRILPS